MPLHRQKMRKCINAMYTYRKNACRRHSSSKLLWDLLFIFAAVIVSDSGHARGAWNWITKLYLVIVLITKRTWTEEQTFANDFPTYQPPKKHKSMLFKYVILNIDVQCVLIIFALARVPVMQKYTSGALHLLTSVKWLCFLTVVCKDFILPMMMQLTGWNERRWKHSQSENDVHCQHNITAMLFAFGRHIRR